MTGERVQEFASAVATLQAADLSGQPQEVQDAVAVISTYAPVFVELYVASRSQLVDPTRLIEAQKALDAPEEVAE